MEDTRETRGLSQRELILELRQDVKGIVANSADERVEVEKELASKVGRAEFWKVLTSIIAISVGAAGIMAALG